MTVAKNQCIIAVYKRYEKVCEKQSVVNARSITTSPSDRLL